jgi:hypothetical protein
LLFAEVDCRKINVLAIQKENELVRRIGFGGNCATGVDFIATVIGYWLEAALDSIVESDLERPQDVAGAAGRISARKERSRTEHSSGDVC